MLASMGWQEGKGIGKSGSGLVKHIHAKKRAVNSGIGADARSDSSGKIDWTLNAVSFETILKGLNQTYTTLDTSMASNEGTNNKQAHVRSDVVGQGEKKKKTARAGRTSVAHQGRYQKRESQKRVQNYSATDLNAILGGVGGFSAAPTPMYSSGGHNAEKAKADKSDAVQSKKRRSANAKNARKRERRYCRRRCHPRPRISLQIRLTRSLHPLKIGGDGQSDSSHLDTMGVGRRKRSLKWTGANEALTKLIKSNSHLQPTMGQIGEKGVSAWVPRL